MKSMVLVTAAVVALADALPGNFMSVASKHEHGEVAARYVKGVQQPIEPPNLSGSTIQGCYKSSGKLEFQKVIEWNTIGSCGNDLCRAEGFKVGGTTGGNQCWCGNTYPPKDDLVDSKNCDVGCTGFGDHACGGIDFWTIYHTGVTLSVKNDASPPKSTSSSDSPKATETESKPQETVVVTESPTSEPESDSSGPNVAGIAAGVVVGVVVIASAIGGGFLYMRRKRNQEIEEEHRRNAAVNAFIGKPPRSSGGTSTTDSRMDPVMAHRRMSDGSIADNQDYSRRILRVTNA